MQNVSMKTSYGDKWHQMKGEGFEDNFWTLTGSAYYSTSNKSEGRRSLHIKSTNIGDTAYADKNFPLASSKYKVTLDVYPVSITGDTVVAFAKKIYPDAIADKEEFFHFIFDEEGKFKVKYFDASGKGHVVDTTGRFNFNVWNTAELMVDWVNNQIIPRLNNIVLPVITTANIQYGAFIACRIGDWSIDSNCGNVYFDNIKVYSYEDTTRTALQKAEAIADKWKERTEITSNHLWRVAATPPGEEFYPEVQITQRYDILGLKYLYLVNGNSSYNQAVNDFVDACYTDNIGIHVRDGNIRYLVDTCSTDNLPTHRTLDPAPNEINLLQRPSDYKNLWERAYKERYSCDNYWGTHHWMPFCWFWMVIEDLKSYTYKTEYNEISDSGARALANLWYLYLYTNETKWREMFDNIIDTWWRERSQYTNLGSACSHKTIREGEITIDKGWDFEMFSLNLGTYNLYYFMLCLDDLYDIGKYYEYVRVQADGWAKYCWREDEVGGGWFGNIGHCDVGTTEDKPWHFWQWMGGITYARMAEMTGNLKYQKYATDILTFLRNHKWRMEDKSILLSAQLAAYLYIKTHDNTYWDIYEEFMHFFEHAYVANDWIYTTCYYDTYTIGNGPEDHNIGNGATHFWTPGMYIFNQLMRDKLKPMLSACPFALMYPVAIKSPILPPADKFSSIAISGAKDNIIQVTRTESSSQDVYISVSGLVAEGYTNFEVKDDGDNSLDFSLKDVGGYYYIKVLSTTATIIKVTASQDTTVPREVTGLSIPNISSTSLELTWEASEAPDLHHYNVYRSTTSGFTPGSSNLIAIPRTNKWYDKGLLPDKTYYYKVKAVDIAGNKGAVSNEARKTTKAV